MPPESDVGPLARFQDGFAALLLDPEAREARSPALAALVRQPGFAVYQNTTIKALIDALEANYPAVARLTGDEWFRACAAIYVRAHLPSDPSLVRYGNGFAAFLASFEPAAALSYLAGVACLDRFWTEAHVARDETAVEPEALGSLPPDASGETVLTPHPSARWAWFDDEPVFTIWQRNRASGPYDDSPIAWRGEGALVVRPRDAVRWLPLDRAECALLDACALGRTLAEAAAATRDVDANADVCALLARLLTAGAFGAAALRQPSSQAREP